MSKLIGSRLDVLLMRGNLLLGRWPGGDPARAVEARSIVHDRSVVNHRAVNVYIAHNGCVHVHNGSVVAERSAGPHTTPETNTTIPESVVDAAIESDVRPPITAVPSIDAAAKTPISRSPKHAYPGWLNPDAGNPIIAVGSVRPIAGIPKIAIDRAAWLHVDGQDRRGNCDRNGYASGGHRRRKA
jgi:hypothetical protein